MSYTFETAAPVKIQGTGRKAEPNPFTDVVKSLGLEPDPKTGESRALAFIEEIDLVNLPEGKTADDVYRSFCTRIGHKLTDAGNMCDPKVTVRRDFKILDEKTEEGFTVIRVTFWCIPKKTQ